MFVNDETNSHLKLYWLPFPHLSAGKQTSSIIVALMCLSESNSNSIQRFHFWTRPRIQTQFFCMKFYATSPQSFCPFIKCLQAKPSYTAAVCDLSLLAKKMHYYNKSVMRWSVYFIHKYEDALQMQYILLYGYLNCKVHTHTHTHTYIYIYIHIYIYIYIYIYLFIFV